MEKSNSTTFSWAVRIDSNLRKPVSILAAEKGIEIQEIVSEAVRKAIGMS